MAETLAKMKAILTAGGVRAKALSVFLTDLELSHEAREKSLELERELEEKREIIKSLEKELKKLKTEDG